MKPFDKIAKFVFGLCVLLTLNCAIVYGEDSSSPSDGLVKLNFPENLELKVLIDYVGKRHGVNFIYDETIGNLRVTIKAVEELPASSLMTLLESALKMKGLSMSKSDIEGMMKIERAVNLTTTSAGLSGDSAFDKVLRPTVAITRVFELKYISTQRAEQIITPFLSAATANITALAEHSMLILTDYVGNMRRLENLLALIDQPGRKVQISFVDVKNMPASDLSQQLTQLLSAKNRTAGSGKSAGADSSAAILVNQWKNQIAVVGLPGEVTEIESLAASLDVPLNMDTQVYNLTVIAPDRFDEIIKKMIGDHAAKTMYKSVSDSRGSKLIITASSEIHSKVADLQEKLDKPLDDAQSPIRFYKLENTNAVDILSTLESIEGDSGLNDVSVDGINSNTGSDANAHAAANSGDERAVALKDARIMADESSNTIIIIAKPAMQAVYEKLIKRLDVRRPQVLLEATIVTVDTTDGFSLGVEVFQEKDGLDAGRLLNFTHYGLTTKTIEDGIMTTVMNPGTGFNGALLDSDVANVVINALESDVRAKVVSRPNVLVNDNAKGMLVSESEEPYSSVNASSTVATTSFAGYSSAGTNITITPHISQGDYLKLEYEITLSSFIGERVESLPPSRQSNTLSSEVTIPDGQTIVVGGLTRENYSESKDSIPFLGRIPYLGYLFANTSESQRKTTLFAFIRAVILREDKFEDLKILSQDAAVRAELDSDFPISEPVAIR